MDRQTNKTSIWNRLRRAFLIVAILPVLVLGGYMVYSSIRFVRNERMLEADKLMEQNVADLNNRMEQCETSLLYVASNYSLQEFLQMDETKYIEVNQASRNVAPMLYNVLLSNQYYKKLRIYSDKHFSVMDDLLKKSDEVRDEEWYQGTIETSQSRWWFDGNNVFLSRKIETSFPMKSVGVIRADIKERLFNGSFQIFSDVPVRIMMNESTLLYQSDDWEDDYYTRTINLLPDDWTVTYRISRDYFFPNSLISVAAPIIMILIVLLASLLVIHIILKNLTREVNNLVGQVEKVKAGDLDVQFTPLQTRELDILSSSMNEMLERIRQLIQKVYQDELNQKDLELELLRSKISPHFLYNNLSAINWLAIEKGEDEIYEITTQMATFYRTALNKGKTTDRFQTEITNAKAYISLQLMSHDHSFEVNYSIAEETLDMVIPTFILQPLIENAIEHGIDQLRGKKGYLEIRSWMDGEDLVLEVLDNGTGLYEKMGTGILDESKYGYGTGNVNRRIRLIHGEEYGLTIMVNEGGTTSRLRLKADKVGISSAPQEIVS